MINEDIIIKRSSALYSKYGIKSVSIDDVAFMLGISKKTLYDYIENKNVLIQKVVENNLDVFYSKIMDKIVQTDDIFTNLCRIYLNIIKGIKKTNPSYVHDLKKYHNNQYKKIIDFRDNILYETIINWINKGIQSGIFRNDIDTKLVYFNQMHKILVLLYDPEGEFLGSFPTQIIYKLILNDIRGITTLKGHEIFDQNYEKLLQLK